MQLQARNGAAISSIVLAVALILLQSLPSLANVAASASTPNTSTSGGHTAMGFAALDPRASYGIPYYNTQAVQQADLSMLISTGIQCVRVDIGYAPWLTGDSTTISLIDSVVSSIRSAGKCLIIADAASETYRGTGALPWTQFKEAWVQRVQTLAARYHPNFYIVVKEPGWYVPMVSDASTNPAFWSASDWAGLTKNLTSAVHSVSSTTKTGVSVGADVMSNNTAYYVSYLGEVQSLSGVSFIGFDIYDSKGQTATQNYLSGYPPSKNVWVAETWSADGPQIYNSTNAQSDALWMKSIYYFAQSIGAKMLIPFYTDLFSGYTIPTDTNSLLTFYDGRTPVYTEFCNVVAGKP